MFDATEPGDLAALREAITHATLLDENTCLAELVALLPADDATLDSLTHQTCALIQRVRELPPQKASLDPFLREYGLDNREGLLLMGLAEALLRIPDGPTADALIRDRLCGADWAAHLGSSDSALVNVASRGLVLGSRLLDLAGEQAPLLGQLVGRLGEPVLRSAIYGAMGLLGQHFVLGPDLPRALKVSRRQRAQGFSHTYDMLGESALTQADADRYLAAYLRAIDVVGAEGARGPSAASVSIKLSALHPRYEEAQRERVLTELGARLMALLERARAQGVAVSIDAEEMARLELSLDLFVPLYRSAANRGWGGLGLVVQAYSKRALPVLRWLTALARAQGDLIPVRLVKGAYWDSEIKLAQQAGLPDYPLFTRKAATDVAYLACAHYLLSEATRGALLPQFATHNAQTLMAILQLAGDRPFELQRLHGMGESLYRVLLDMYPGLICRIYAPIGAHQELLPYLVRRLLENGANSAFVHQLRDPAILVATLAEHPLRALKGSGLHRSLPLPPDLFVDRCNSGGISLHFAALRRPLLRALAPLAERQWQGGPLVDGQMLRSGEPQWVSSPQAISRPVGRLYQADEAVIEQALASAYRATERWRETAVSVRAEALERLADLLEANRPQLVSLCIREAGKLLQDGLDEVREAVDFCRYYASEGRRLMGQPQQLPGYTGEQNDLYLRGRGLFVCISPWNFPLSIFIGQVAAALITGNTVLAKPAEQSSLIAHLAVSLAHQAGIPPDVLHLLPGDGPEVGGRLLQDPRIGGVCFTGSTETARLINQALAARPGAILPLIAETGGQNAMIVDATALPEQVVRDVLSAAFQSAGQRCSALRVLYLQEEIAERVMAMLAGAMQTLVVGDPADYATDVGPVIDRAAQVALLDHLARMLPTYRLIAQSPLPASTQHGYFVPPTAIEIPSIKVLTGEQFGPILHVVRYRAADLMQVIAEINGTGYGLTLGIHSRNHGYATQLARQIHAGNVYINRSQIGAVVGVQPFGGQGLSGTGPKAGGPHYLLRFVTEQTRTINTTAMGGNAALLTRQEANSTTPPEGGAAMA